MHFQAGDIKVIPVIDDPSVFVDEIVKENVFLSKKDWDYFETSWDFKKHPLV